MIPDLLRFASSPATYDKNNFNQNGTINSNTGVMLSAGKDFTNTGTVTGPMVGIFADGKVTNQSTLSAPTSSA